MVELQNVSICFSGEPVLENCSFVLHKGEHAAVMGPSGSGKTTLLRLISGKYHPNAGTISVNARKISYLFQEPRLLPWFTAEENVNLVLSDGPETMEEARYWLRAVGLADAMRKHPGQLSGGMRQRVALARALAYNGDLFLLDEPMSALDAKLSGELLELLKRYLQGKSMMIVTHSLEQARQTADHIYLLKNKTLEPLE